MNPFLLLKVYITKYCDSAWASAFLAEFLNLWHAQGHKKQHHFPQVFSFNIKWMNGLSGLTK
jgi:hypothetical protein